MSLRSSCFVLTLSLLFFVAPLRAQDSERWYYAWKVSPGELIAYTPAGETRVLIESGVQRYHDVIRVNDFATLGTFTVNDEYGVYALKPDGATQLQFDFDIEAARAADTLDIFDDELHFYFREFHYPYAIIKLSENPRNAAAVLANLDTGQMQRLGENAISFATRFSADGRYLRYFHLDSSEEWNWTLRERKLETNTERVFYEVIHDRYPSLRANIEGNRWSYRRHDSVTQTITDTLIESDGRVEVINEAAIPGSYLYFLSEDFIFASPTFCQFDCTAQLISLTGDRTLIFPTLADVIAAPIARPSETVLIVLDAGEEQVFWQLEIDKEPVRIGKRPLSDAFPLRDGILSPDDRYLFVLTDNNQSFGVFDIHDQVFVVEGESDGLASGQIRFAESGFMVSHQFGKYYLYQSADEQVIALPEKPGGVFFDLLNDGTLLYQQRTSPLAEVALGIHRYDPESEAFTLLVEDAIPIMH